LEKQVSLFAGYVAIFDRATETFTTYRHDSANPQSLSHDVIWDIHEDRAGTLWVGTDGGGLNRFDPATGTFTHYRHDPNNPHSLGNDWVWAIDEDQQGSIWLGTLGGGLNRLEPATGHITRYQQDLQNPASLSDDSISTLHMDRSGVLWVGTFGGGLDRFDPARGTFTHYRERDGLPSDRTVSILEDGDAGETAAGNLWIATGRGLSKLDRDRTTFNTYDTTDGLPLTEYNRGRYRTRSGELLMSRSHGLIAFDPAAVRDDVYVTPVVFTNFLLARRPVTISQGVRMSGERASSTHPPITQEGTLGQRWFGSTAPPCGLIAHRRRVWPGPRPGHPWPTTA
jgi:streptogramin lyase